MSKTILFIFNVFVDSEALIKQTTFVSVWARSINTQATLKWQIFFIFLHG